MHRTEVTMKVSQSNSNPVQNSETANAKKAERAEKMEELKKIRDSRVEAAANNESVKTDISAKGKEFSKAKAIAAQVPEVREGKVENLKKQIAEGKYKVDADKIADKMIDDHMSTADLG